MSDVKLWEILVPGSYGKTRFSYEHHKEWDKFVREKANGLTILKGVKGEWVNDTGTVHVDKVIPVRVACSRKIIEEIMLFTTDHYNQEAVFAYEISSTVIVKFREENGNS